MPTVRNHLRYAENHLEIARTHLERALHRAKAITHDPLWIAAINKALADNKETSLHISNVGTLFGLATEPPI